MKYLILALALVVSGCVSNDVTPINTGNDVAIIKPERPAPILSPNVTIRVITPAIAQEMLDKQVPFVYYGLNEASYLELAKWLQDNLRYLKEQNEIIEYYEKQVDKNGKPKSGGTGE